MRGLGVFFDSLLLSDVVVWWWLAVDVSPPIACHGGTVAVLFGLRRMLNSMVNTRDSRFILVQALDRISVLFCSGRTRMRGLGVLFDSLLLSDVVVWWWLSVNADPCTTSAKYYLNQKSGTRMYKKEERTLRARVVETEKQRDAAVESVKNECKGVTGSACFFLYFDFFFY